MTWGEVAVAQVAAGGTIVQGVVALIRRRSELRQLDRSSDSVAVETADHVVNLLRTELDATKAENAALKTDLADQHQSGARSYTLPGYAWMLDKLVVYVAR
ncbi:MULTISPECIES: hypothetical protein [unclassified Nonomuraea]|uniref:hypothetical protein n=1 Tax=unclassified Nonomuraea TaxID=2593643 RepID=UPI003402CE62